MSMGCFVDVVWYGLNGTLERMGCIPLPDIEDAAMPPPKKPSDFDEDGGLVVKLGNVFNFILQLHAT